MLYGVRKQIRYTLDILSIEEPRYWLAAYDKSPNLLDFAIIKGMNKTHFEIQSCLELSSDHSPVLLKYMHKPVFTEIAPPLCSNTTNWELFKKHIEENINCSVPLKTPDQFELAVINFTSLMKDACCASTKTNRGQKKTEFLPRNTSYKKLSINAN